MQRSSPIPFALLAGALALPLAAQQQPPAPRQAAVLRTSAPIAIDGRLDETAWREAVPATGFVQREPVEGAAAPEDTEVRFLVTGDALVIGARMHSRRPDLLNALVARRDAEVPSEQLRISLDTRRDRVTAYTFGVTVGAVRSEVFHSSDNEGSQDDSYDPVWQAATAVDSAGWTAELRIPLTQLRFDGGDDVQWGLNITREVPARNERTFWILVGRQDNGWSSRMGRLTGLGALRSPRRLEVVPYLAMEGIRQDEIDTSDPFAKRTDGTVRVGGDVKLGLGRSLTLDATINPDFGQVEADPAQVNLSAFEVSFSERRPFFVEGSNLLGGRNTFYSRRIGAQPPGSSGAPYAEEARNSTILGAAKVTGRLPSGLSIGALTALTARERVRTWDPETATYGRATVAPRTAYGIATLQQEFGRDRSTLKASVTGVERDLEHGSSLDELLARRAYTALIDGRLRWARGRYDVSAYAMTSHVEGSEAAMLRQQRSSRRFYQRPDADYVALDPTRTTLNGTGFGINHSKMAGNWLWDVDYTYSSPGLELNDIGFLTSVDEHFASGNLRYRRTTPGKVLHNWTAGVELDGVWNGGGVRNGGEVEADFETTFTNFWEGYVGVSHSPRAQSDDITRGGPLMMTPRTSSVYAELSNADGATTNWFVGVEGVTDEFGGWLTEVQASLAFRPGPRWELSVEPSWSRERSSRQYVATRTGGSAATFGGRYLFGEVQRSEIAMQLRANYAITPNLTVEGYFEPFASSGRYSGFGELRAARSGDLRRYGQEGSTITRVGDEYRVVDGGQEFAFDAPDFNVRSFRSNLVLRWEWLPGSTAFLVWQQDRFEERQKIASVRPGGLFEAIGAPGNNVLALKISYWMAR